MIGHGGRGPALAYRGEGGRYAPPTEPLAASSDEEVEVEAEAVAEDEEAMEGALEVRLGLMGCGQLPLLGCFRVLLCSALRRAGMLGAHAVLWLPALFALCEGASSVLRLILVTEGVSALGWSQSRVTSQSGSCSLHAKGRQEAAVRCLCI